MNKEQWKNWKENNPNAYSLWKQNHMKWFESIKNSEFWKERNRNLSRLKTKWNLEKIKLEIHKIILEQNNPHPNLRKLGRLDICSWLSAHKIKYRQLISELEFGFNPSTNQEKLGYLIGVLLGDGYLINWKKERKIPRRGIIQKYTFGLNTTDKDFAKEFLRVGENFSNIKGIVYETKPHIYKFGKRSGISKRQFCVNFNNKEFYEYMIQKKNIDYLLNNLQTFSKEFLIGLLRGLWDSEGNLSIDKKYKKYHTLSFYNKNPKNIQLFINVCKVLGLQPSENVRISNKEYNVLCAYIYGHKKIKEFINLIKPTIQRKLLKQDRIRFIFKQTR